MSSIVICCSAVRTLSSRRSWSSSSRNFREVVSEEGARERAVRCRASSINRNVHRRRSEPSESIATRRRTLGSSKLSRPSSSCHTLCFGIDICQSGVRAASHRRPPTAISPLLPAPTAAHLSVSSTTRPPRFELPHRSHPPLAPLQPLRTPRSSTCDHDEQHPPPKRQGQVSDDVPPLPPTSDRSLVSPPSTSY